MSMYRRARPVRPYRGMGATIPFPELSGAIDYTNPGAIINPGDLVPDGDTYAGSSPITVAQWQAAVQSGAPVPTTSGGSLASWIGSNQTTILISLAVVAGLAILLPSRR